jgi:hypothetical protein
MLEQQRRDGRISTQFDWQHTVTSLNIREGGPANEMPLCPVLAFVAEVISMRTHSLQSVGKAWL